MFKIHEIYKYWENGRVEFGGRLYGGSSAEEKKNKQLNYIHDIE